jgi:NAD(P)-dependent dehydrogenase (short-subunit alcohol dehydrogenase family)
VENKMSLQQKPKIIMITGANSGIGKAAAAQLAQQGHHIILACRNPTKGEGALSDVKALANSEAVELMIVDMSSQTSIRAISAEFLRRHEVLDVLIHNAAVFDITQKEPVFTNEGIESVWATNHVGPVLLTECLWPALENSSQGRVITIASKGLIAKPFLKVDLDDAEFKNRPFSVEKAYYQSKQAQIMYTYWLADRGRTANISANCIRVPAVQVDIGKYSNLPNFMKKLYAFKSRFALSPKEMADTYSFLATSDEVSAVTGGYFDENKKQVQSAKYTRQPQQIAAVMDLTMRYFDSALQPSIGSQKSVVDSQYDF